MLRKTNALWLLAGLTAAAGVQASTLQAPGDAAGWQSMKAESGAYVLAQAGPGQGGMGPGGMGGPGGGQSGMGPGRMGGPGGGRGRHPPREAVAACQGKASGAACSFTGRQNETLQGRCFGPPAGGQRPQEGQAAGARSPAGAGDGAAAPLACRPDRGGAPPQR